MTGPIKTYLKVSGMTCGSCRRHVEDALAGVDQVDTVHVDLKSGTATVASFAAVDGGALLDAVRDAGYDATIVEDCSDEAAVEIADTHSCGL